jgi:hypothetical protein
MLRKPDGHWVLVALKERLGLQEIHGCYLGDTKLDTPENLAAAQSTAGEFLCAGAFTRPLQARFREVRDRLKPVAY